MDERQSAGRYAKAANLTALLIAQRLSENNQRILGGARGNARVGAQQTHRSLCLEQGEPTVARARLLDPDFIEW
jgi:hypothetical protein